MTPEGEAPFLRSAPERREIALTLGMILLLSIPSGLLQLVDARWGLLVSQILFIAAPVFLAIRVYYLDARTVLAIRRPRARHVAGAVLGTAGLNHFLAYAGAWQDRFFPVPEWIQNAYRPLTTFHDRADWVILPLLVGVVPGVCEELLFRGFVQSGLVREFESAPKAIVVTSIVFAAFHFNPWLFAWVAVIGLYLGFLVHRTGSLVPAILAHALNNVLSIAVEGLPDAWQDRLGQSPWSHAAATVCLLAAALLLRRVAPRAPETRML